MEKRRETKTRQEGWWFNQGSPLSIRHSTGGASDIDEQKRSERENERRQMRGTREDSKRMIGEILQDCSRKARGGTGGQAEGN